MSEAPPANLPSRMRKHWIVILALAVLLALVIAYAAIPGIRRPVEQAGTAFADAVKNPWVFFPLLFVYAILIAIILPVPIEPILLLPEVFANQAFFWGAALTVGTGKAVGAWLIFRLGTNFEEFIHTWSRRMKLFRLVVDFSEWFVKKTRYVGLYVLLSIPFMSDTAILYIYSLFNPKASNTKDEKAEEPAAAKSEHAANPGRETHALHMTPFVLANFLAGVTRVVVFVVAVRAGVCWVAGTC